MNVNNFARKPIRRNALWLLRFTALRPTLLSAHLIALIFISFLCQKSLADTNPVPPVFELTHTFGGATTFIIKIHPDGKVHFHRNEVDLGRRYSAKAEDRYAQMTPEQLNELVNVFLSLPFESAKKLEPTKDSATVPFHSFITYKDKYINITIEDIIFSVFLKNRMGKYINLKQLLCAENQQDDCDTNVSKIPGSGKKLSDYTEDESKNMFFDAIFEKQHHVDFYHH